MTVFSASPPISIGDGKHCGPEILKTVVDPMASLGLVPYATDWEYVLILGATHARCLADAGWSKDEVREFIYVNLVMPWGKYKQQYPGLQGTEPAWIGHTNDDSTSIHFIDSPKNINVIVAGGEAPYSQVIKCSYKGVTKEIKLPNNWAGLLKSVK